MGCVSSKRVIIDNNDEKNGCHSPTSESTSKDTIHFKSDEKNAWDMCFDDMDDYDRKSIIFDEREMGRDHEISLDFIGHDMSASNDVNKENLPPSQRSTFVLCTKDSLLLIKSVQCIDPAELDILDELKENSMLKLSTVMNIYDTVTKQTDKETVTDMTLGTHDDNDTLSDTSGIDEISTHGGLGTRTIHSTDNYEYSNKLQDQDTDTTQKPKIYTSNVRKYSHRNTKSDDSSSNKLHSQPQYSSLSYHNSNQNSQDHLESHIESTIDNNNNNNNNNEVKDISNSKGKKVQIYGEIPSRARANTTNAMDTVIDMPNTSLLPALKSNTSTRLASSNSTTSLEESSKNVRRHSATLSPLPRTLIETTTMDMPINTNNVNTSNPTVSVMDSDKVNHPLTYNNRSNSHSSLSSTHNSARLLSDRTSTPPPSDLKRMRDMKQITNMLTASTNTTESNRKIENTISYEDSLSYVYSNETDFTAYENNEFMSRSRSSSAVISRRMSKQSNTTNLCMSPIVDNSNSSINPVVSLDDDDDNVMMKINTTNLDNSYMSEVNVNEEDTHPLSGKLNDHVIQIREQRSLTIESDTPADNTYNEISPHSYKSNYSKYSRKSHRSHKSNKNSPSSSSSSPTTRKSIKNITMLCPGKKIPIREKPHKEARIVGYLHSDESFIAYNKTYSGYYRLIESKGYVNKATRTVEWIETDI